jgi:hypothetical protein
MLEENNNSMMHEKNDESMSQGKKSSAKLNESKEIPSQKGKVSEV